MEMSVDMLLQMGNGQFALDKGSVWRLFFRPEKIGISDPGHIYALVKDRACSSYTLESCKYTYDAFILTPGEILNQYVTDRFREGYDILNNIREVINIDPLWYQKKVGGRVNIHYGPNAIHKLISIDTPKSKRIHS